jgi:hypothetical protein
VCRLLRRPHPRVPGRHRHCLDTRRRRLRRHRSPRRAGRRRPGLATPPDFKQAWEAKDIDALIGLLDPGATAISDGGGLVSAALRPIEGAEQIARHYVDIAAITPSNVTILERTVNGRPGLVAQHDGVIVTVFAFDLVGDRINHIWAIRNPDKLRPWTTD